MAVPATGFIREGLPSSDDPEVRKPATVNIIVSYRTGLSGNATDFRFCA